MDKKIKLYKINNDNIINKEDISGFVDKIIICL